jgi:hypothetical protein
LIFYILAKIVDCIFLKIVDQHVCFVKGRGHVVVGKETLKYMQAFWKSARFSLTLSLRQQREVNFFVTLFLSTVVSPVNISSINLKL